MNLSKFNFPVLAIMLCSVLSLNISNPLASQHTDDAMGIAKKLSVSTAQSSSDVNVIPTVAVAFVAYVLLRQAARPAQSDVSASLLDGATAIGAKKLALSKLD